MKKFKVALMVDSNPFERTSKDIYETMESIKLLAKHLKKPLSQEEEFNTLKDLVELEHRREDACLRISGRPISVAITLESILGVKAPSCGSLCV